MAERDRRVQWSQLPEELLSLISKKYLNNRVDNLRLRSICNSWRSSIPLFTKPPPLLLPSPTTRHQRQDDGYLSLIESTIYLLQNPKPNTPTSTPWLIRVQELENGKMRALHPLFQTRMPETFPKQVNLLDFGVTEIGKTYNLRFTDLTKQSSYSSVDDDDDDSTVFEKVVVSSSPWSDDSSEGFAVMGRDGGNLRFLKVGDEKWNTIDWWFYSSCYEDFVYHKGKFYAVGSNGRIVVIGSDLKPEPIASLGNDYRGIEFGKVRLVKSCDDLFLIDKDENFRYNGHYEYCGDHMWQDIESEPVDPVRSVYLKVFKLNERKKKWERIGSLGDRVLFVCDAFSYSVSARDFSGLKEGCIYLSEGIDMDGEEYDEEYYEEYNEELRPWFADTVVFSLLDGRGGELAYFPDHSQIFRPPSTSSCAIKKRM